MSRRGRGRSERLGAPSLGLIASLAAVVALGAACRGAARSPDAADGAAAPPNGSATTGSAGADSTRAASLD